MSITKVSLQLFDGGRYKSPDGRYRLFHHLRADIQVGDETYLGGRNRDRQDVEFPQPAARVFAGRAGSTSKMMILVSTGMIFRTNAFFSRAAGNPAGMRMVDRQPVDMMPEGIDPRGRHEPGLTHPAAKDLPYPPRLPDKGSRSHQDAPDRTTQPFVETN
jgi:hypothetical protein